MQISFGSPQMLIWFWPLPFSFTSLFTKKTNYFYRYHCLPKFFQHHNKIGKLCLQKFWICLAANIKLNHLSIGSRPNFYPFYSGYLSILLQLSMKMFPFLSMSNEKLWKKCLRWKQLHWRAIIAFILLSERAPET